MKFSKPVCTIKCTLSGFLLWRGGGAWSPLKLERDVGQLRFAFQDAGAGEPEEVARLPGSRTHTWADSGAFS